MEATDKTFTPQFDLFSDLELTENIEFQEYHQKHPEVYKKFKELALDAIRRGHKHFSGRGILQVARFYHPGEIKEDGYKINNNYSPYYVRLFKIDFPQHANFFETRKTKYAL